MTAKKIIIVFDRIYILRKSINSMSEKPDETKRGPEEVDARGVGSQMDNSKRTKGGFVNIMNI